MSDVVPDDRAWLHARWIEPHKAIPDPDSIAPLRAHGGRLGASCLICDEVLYPLDRTTHPTSPSAQCRGEGRDTEERSDGE